MGEDSPLVYFANCKLFEVTEILMKNTDINDADKQVLEKYFWEQALHQHKIDKPGESRLASGELGWEQSWSAIRLLRVLHTRTSGSITPEMDGTLVSSRKEIFFISLLQSLGNFTSEICKELKALFSKVLLAHLISRTKILPKLSIATEQALLRSLVSNPGETHFLLELISCDHEAFADVTKVLKGLYTSAVMNCLHSITDCDEINKKKHINNLYALLLLLTKDALSVAEEIGRQLYSLCQIGVLDLAEVLLVTASCRSLYLYTYLTGCENRRLLRHTNCTSTADIDLVNNVFAVITDYNKLNLQELCLRTISSKSHWVEELIGMATQFVISKDKQKLETLMRFPALWPALAINIWKLFSSRSDILDIVMPIIEICLKEYPNLFIHLKHTLDRLKSVCDWLQEEDRSCLPSAHSLLTLSHGHSPLYLLQTTTRFQGLDHGQLHDLLLDLEGPNSWSVRVFDGFTVIFSMFNILVKAVDIFIEHKNEPLLMYAKYNEEVTKPIMALNQSINKLEPLDFRIEILENIFLLLFLRSEDFCEDKDDEISTDDNDEANIQVVSSVPEEVVLKSVSLPSPLYGKCPSSRASSSSSYPCSSQRKNTIQLRPKILPVRNSQGFICYPWLVNDILSCLEISIENSETNCDTKDCDRLNRLKKSVEDARWRFDMISEPHRDMDFTNLDVFKEVARSWTYSRDDSSESEGSSNPPSPVCKTKRQRKASKSESGSNTTNARRTSSSTNSLMGKKNSKLFSTSSSLINLMLSSPESLVSYFIAREDLEKANKAVLKFNLSGSFIDTELNFLKEFSQLRKDLGEIQLRSSQDKSPLKESALQAINQTTSSGVLTITVTHLIETFFAVTQLPEECSENKGVVVLDLAVSQPGPPQLSACLLALAFNYFNCGPTSPVITALKAMTTSLRSVLQEVEGPTSLPGILLDPSLPLRGGSNIKQIKEFWTSLEECITGFQKALVSGDDNLADAAYLRLTACAVTGQGLVQNYQDDSKQHFMNQLRSYLSCLWKVVSHIIPEGTKYHIMNHSLDSLIGELVFAQGRDPMALETALQPLPLNVVHLVVTNCTPSITIQRLRKLPPCVILNLSADQKPVDNSRDPLELVSSLLTNLLECLDCSSSESLACLPSSTSVQRALDATYLLLALDWVQLTSGDLIFTFLVNLYNLMWLHALITLEIQEEYGLVSTSTCLRELSTNQVGYQVGGFFVTLAELRDTLIPYPTSDFALPHKALPVSASSDPRAVFLLANHYRLSPAVQVLPSREMDKEIDARVTSFVAATVQVSEDSVSVPTIIQQYVNHITMTQGAESECSPINTHSSNNEHILDFLKETLKRDVLGKDIVIKKDFGITITKKLSRLYIRP